MALLSRGPGVRVSEIEEQRAVGECMNGPLVKEEGAGERRMAMFRQPTAQRLSL